MVRLHPWTRVKTQNWNMVYVPYCTGDIYSGDKVAVYQDPTGQKPQLIWHHNGLRNTRAVTAWLRTTWSARSRCCPPAAAPAGRGA